MPHPQPHGRHLKTISIVSLFLQPISHLRLICQQSYLSASFPITNRKDEACCRSNASMVMVPILSDPSFLPKSLTSNLKLMTAYCSIVISVFAIVILSVIGALFKSNHHSLMGSTNDPPVNQGPAVAATVFSAVIVYAVCSLPKPCRYSTLPSS